MVGWEGFWGMCMLSTVLLLMYLMPGAWRAGAGDALAVLTPAPDATGDRAGSFENAADAAVQMTNSTLLLLAILGNVASIAFFNFFGISVTSELSAVHRMVLDSLR